MIANSGQIIAAFRDMAATKNLSVDELNELIQDGIMAGLARIHGPNVRAEIDVDDMSGAIDIVVLKRVETRSRTAPRRFPWRKPAGTTRLSKSGISWKSPWTSPSSDATR